MDALAAILLSVFGTVIVVIIAIWWCISPEGGIRISGLVFLRAAIVPAPVGSVGVDLKPGFPAKVTLNGVGVSN